VQVDAMAALAQQSAAEGLRKHALIVSSAHLDVHALASIFAAFLSAWKVKRLLTDGTSPSLATTD
jgi:hypothetical protein